MADFNPGKLLKDKILDNIQQVQIVVFGNTSRDDAIAFSEIHIVPKFKCIERSDNFAIRVGCLYKEDEYR